MTKHLLSLVAEKNVIRTALLKMEKGTIALESVKSFFASESIVNQLYISTPLSSKIALQIATALDSHDVLYRTLSLPISNQQKALAALPFQLEAILPFPTEEAVVAASFKPIGKEAFTVSLFAAQASALEAHLSWTQSLQIDPDIITCTPNALHRLAKWLFPQETTFSLFHFGETKSCCVIAINDELALTQTLHFGHADFLQALAKDFPEKSLDEIEALAQNPDTLISSGGDLIHFNQTKERIKKEIERLFVYLQSKNALIENAEWILLGDQYSSFPCSAFWATPSAKSLLNAQILTSDLQRYALTIGIALDAISQDAHSVQFRRDKWISPRSVEKRKKNAFRYLALCAGASIVMGLGGQALLNKKENLLVQQLTSHLPPSLSKAPIHSPEEIEHTLWQWESSLGTQKLPFPFLPTVPSVSDILAWLSSHPCLSTPEGGKKEGIEIKNIRYQLYKHPKLGEPGGLYAAKVDLEFTAATPRLAREFHDALLKGDLIVNGKKEIKWNSQQNTYWASFELNPLKKGHR